MKLVNIGYGNMVNAERIVAVIGPESAPVKRMIQEAREKGLLIDASCGRRTRTVMVTDSDHLVLAAIAPEVASARIAGEEAAEDEE